MNKQIIITNIMYRRSSIVAVFILLFARVSSQCDVARVCVTDMSVADCAQGQILAPNLTVLGCCPGCVFPPGNGSIITDEGCHPPSNCLPDGRFASVQCKGDMFTGRCFCSDEDGRRIFGQMWRSDASEMACACSRKRAELEKSGRAVTLHCTGNGDYEPLQCDGGICWCVEPKTGQPTVTPVMEEDMTRLPCFSSAVNGEQYLRRCESIVHSLARIHEEQSAHGTNFLGDPTTFCDYDGSYGPYQIQNGIAYCTGRDGEILGAWQVMASEMAGMNCNCARDTRMYFPERGMSVTEVCSANGNYQPHQNVGDVYYCVDRDGYPIALLDAWPTDRCASYA